MDSEMREEFVTPDDGAGSRPWSSHAELPLSPDMKFARSRLTNLLKNIREKDVSRRNAGSDAQSQQFEESEARRGPGRPRKRASRRLRAPREAVPCGTAGHVEKRGDLLAVPDVDARQGRGRLYGRIRASGAPAARHRGLPRPPGHQGHRRPATAPLGHRARSPVSSRSSEARIRGTRQRRLPRISPQRLSSPLAKRQKSDWCDHCKLRERRHNKSIQLLETVYGIAQQTSI
ncbi:hypothetical protein L596_014077 [Steinernema carpocapsae]|uniref:Uncharacterized protein n=1 Tax=Steinernema carpocapsae TaxID=34508 RepID=A0A4U5NAF2_STECR|nr:hypothetical protein L596_014077 [Steinernema carpocapsae]